MADAVSARSTLTVGDASSRSTGSTRCRRAGTSRGCPTRCGSCSRTCSGTATATTSRRSPAGSRPTSRAARSPSPRPASCSRTSPACRPSSTSPRCATRCADLGGDPARINPLIPVELVIDHSVQVDEFGTRGAFARNVELEFERNRERYAFLRWGQKAFRRLQGRPAEHRHRPPGQPRVPRARRRGARRRRRSPTRSSAPTRTRRWSTGSACSAGASAGSRPRRRCSASRSRCSCRRSSASS